MTFICFKPESSSAHGCLQLNFSIPTFFHRFLFLSYPERAEVQVSSFVKGGAFSNREHNFFLHVRNFENRPLKPGNFLS